MIKFNIFSIMIRFPFCFLIFSTFFSTVSLAQVGENFPLWKEGHLDIHHINTGRGDATFFMLPDGTTMLVDAGAHNRPNSPREIPVKPNDSRTPGEWIVKYIQYMLQGHPTQELNYMLVTHFHSDHMGGVGPDLKSSKSGAYQLSGITEVGELLGFDKMIDRAWPTYNWPSDLMNPDMKNYRKFLEWQIANRQVQVEQFEVGRKDQLALINHPDKFPDFEIRNIVANGKVWTGVGSGWSNYFPSIKEVSEDLPTENMSCLGIRLSYGAFDYFTGGDLLGVPPPGAPDWHDIETPVAKAVGPVEVNVTNHHGHFDAQNDFFIRTLRPKIHLIQSWVVNHPAPSTLSRLLSTRLYPGPREVFATNITEVGSIFIGPGADKINGQGHLVIRVDPKGNTFNLFVLDDSDENYTIKAIYGPYHSD
jgi:hypothetical protein